MDTDYWRQRWQEGRTGWHRNEVMPLLTQHWHSLGVARGARVLLPFCGKSLDMIWLAGQGLRVLGVEVSALAIAQFFAENRLKAETQTTADGIHYRAGNIEIIEGDLFETQSATLVACVAVYDRAALIAQPEEERRRYAEEIYGKLSAGCRGLVITLEYPPSQMEGPPFSVDEPEMHRLFSPRWQVETLERHDILASQPRFAEQGLTTLHTGVYRLRRRGDRTAA